MSDKTVQQRLEAVYVELGVLAGRSQDDADRLAALQVEVGEIMQQLPVADLTLSEQLRSGIARFEAEHPTLARAAEEVVDNLARLGI
jgi:hypothetical protein